MSSPLNIWDEKEQKYVPLPCLKGEKGDKGDPAVTDQTYAPTSENAQSGKAVAEAVSDKQDSLVSGTNIKTINNQSILGSGNITIEGGSDVEVDQTYNPESENAQSGKAVAEAVATEQNRADNTFANALKGSKSDTAMLLDDISPVSREMRVKISSDTVPDLTAVKVSRYGKNLFDKNSTIDGYEITNVVEGKISVNKDWFVTDYILVVERYTYKVSGKDSGSSVLFYDKDKKFLGYSAGGGNNIFAVIKNACYVVLNGLLTQKETFQLELGSTATDYEPYKECAEYTPNADGTVNGVTSLYPNTTLMTDTEGVIIDCEYNRDINKAFAALEAAIATNNS